MPPNGLNKVVEHLRSIALRQEAAGMSDTQLLEGFVTARDQVAFAVLVRRYAPLVWNVCRRVLINHHDAEDAFQATFLVLVRKAASIAKRELLANWLYGVAYRTALKARAATARRNKKEQQVPELPEPHSSQNDSWSSLLPFLDQELGRLPDKYRACIVLCDLKGKTRAEAARSLRLPEGTVASRLARARAMLAKRLGRHGIAVSGGSLAALISSNAESACVPAAVVWGTIKAATLLAAGHAAAAGVLSAKAASLAEGVMHAMFLSKMKTVAAAMLVGLAMVGFGGGLLKYGLAAGQAGADGDTLLPKPQQKPKKDKDDSPKLAQGQKKNEQVTGTAATASSILKAFENNAARFDDQYNQKRISVTGKMVRITRQAGDAKEPGYILELECPAAKEKDESIVVSCFFPDSDRKALAQLNEGQEVTVEGDCKVVRPSPAPNFPAVLGGGAGMAGFQGGIGGFPGGAIGGNGLQIPPLGGNLGNPAGVGLPGFPGQPGTTFNPEPQVSITFSNSKIIKAEK
jgi:RNA polymerase sigma factor (sigma-70 family)